MAIHAARDLTYDLNNPFPESLFAIIGNKELAALKTLAEIFESSFSPDAEYTRVPTSPQRVPAPPLRLPIALNPSTRPPTHNNPNSFCNQSYFSSPAVTALLNAPNLTDQIRSQPTQKLPKEFLVNSVFQPDTGKLMQYKQLISDPIIK